MATRWIYELHLVVATAERELANGMAALMDPDRGGANTFLLPLLPRTETDPQASPTHYGAVTAATEAMHLAMNSVAQRGLLKTVRFWRMDAATGHLLESNSPTTATAVGAAWTWERTLEDAGLKLAEGGG